MLVDFWTYTCINCIRTLPYLKAWDASYRRDGLTIVGVETPEFAFERDAANVSNAIKQFGLRYPVVQDNEMGTWNAYGNQYWPADYLIDSTGQVRYATFGEGDYAKTETAIRALLAEAGSNVGGKSHPSDVIVPSQQATPETYLGTERAQGWIAAPKAGVHDYGGPPTGALPLNDFAFSGTWKIAGAACGRRRQAQVSTSSSRPRTSISCSARPAQPRARCRCCSTGARSQRRDAGADVHGAVVTVRGQRLYTLVSLRHDERHRLSLRFAPGVTGYAFTFG